MSHRITVSARTTGGTIAALAMIAAAAILLATPSLAQQPKAQPKGQPKSPPAPPPAAAAPAQGEPRLSYTRWTKVCQKGPEANAKRICFTGRTGSVESGMPVVAAVVIEADGEAKKILRVTLPLGTALQPGTRVIVDEGQPITAPYVLCLNGGCMADYEASGELIDKMKKGQNLVVQGINGSGQSVSIPVPLADFATAYEGAPTDPKVVEDRQKQLEEQLRKRGEEERKRLEGR
jgi:invasion protein IalB